MLGGGGFWKPRPENAGFQKRPLFGPSFPGQKPRDLLQGLFSLQFSHKAQVTHVDTQ